MGIRSSAIALAIDWMAIALISVGVYAVSGGQFRNAWTPLAREP